jgi:hypothetical protein
MIPCQQFRQSILDFIDKELDVLERKKVEQHLSTCQNCNQFYERIRVLRSQLSKIKPIRTPDHFRVLIRERIRRESLKRKSISLFAWLFSGWRWIPASGAIIVLLTLGIWFASSVSFQSAYEMNSQKVNSNISSESLYERRVQYVIDDVPASISVERLTESGTASAASLDSLGLSANIPANQPVFTPISF